jgi:transposase
MRNEEPASKKANGLALMPIVVFLLLYLGTGIYFEYLHPLEDQMGFYIMSVVVAFSIALIVAFMQNRSLDFDQKMHNVLLVYKQLSFQFDENGNLLPFDDEEPVTHVLSYDEKPGIQAIASTSDDLMPDDKHPTISRDYEYKRLGTLSLLAGIDLQTGEAIPLVSDTHNSKDYIEFLKILDNKYPKGDKIRLVLDNLKVHTSEETRRYLASVPGRFEFVFTPKHGSWLNMIEGFFSKMTRQMLRGIRVKSKEELKERIYLYFKEANEEPVVFHWKYNLDDIDVSEEVIVDTLSLKKSS